MMSTSLRIEDLAAELESALSAAELALRRPSPGKLLTQLPRLASAVRSAHRFPWGRWCRVNDSIEAKATAEALRATADDLGRLRGVFRRLRPTLRLARPIPRAKRTPRARRGFRRARRRQRSRDGPGDAEPDGDASNADRDAVASL